MRGWLSGCIEEVEHPVEVGVVGCLEGGEGRGLEGRGRRRAGRKLEGD